MLNVKKSLTYHASAQVSADSSLDSFEDPDGGQPPSTCPSNWISDRRAFRKVYYPEATQKDWDSWQWQLKNRITTLEGLSRIMVLSESERSALHNGSGILQFAVTPYYASLINPLKFDDPMRLSVIPREDEFHISPADYDDPLGEDHDEAVPGLVHRYPDRVLFLVTQFCSTYCRYCTRARSVGDAQQCGSGRWSAAVEYIRNHPEIRDVLISGGDPLTMTDEALEPILAQIRAIPHVEFLRIGTKVPTVLPQRITPKLVKMLKKYHPLFISIHAENVREFTPEAVKACERLADAGIPLGSQTVLLKGVNDSVEEMKALMHKLLTARVKPYYLYQCDPVRGTSHMRTSVEKGLEIIAGLRGFTSGYAVPTYVIDAPGGGGKIPISADNICGVEKGSLLLRNFEGDIYRYPLVDGSGVKR